jgi:hypothetical protein
MRLALLPLLALTPSAAMAQQAPAAPQPANANANANAASEKPICRRVPVTGSNFGKRVCHSRAEWQAIRDADEANAQRALENRAPSPGRD